MHVKWFSGNLLVSFLIELRIFEEFGDTNMKYKNRIRSRVANLKDAKNPALRQNVLKGIIEPAKIAVMTAEVSFFPLCFYLYFSFPFV